MSNETYKNLQKIITREEQQNPADKPASGDQVSLTKKESALQDKPSSKPPGTEPIPNQQTTSPAVTAPTSASSEETRVADWLFNLLGPDLLSAFRSNPNIYLPYVSPDLEHALWLVTALKTILTPEQIAEVAQQISKKIAQPLEDLEDRLNQATHENLRLEEEIARLKAKLEQTKSELENTEIARHRLKENISLMLDARSFVEGFFHHQEDEDVRQLLIEATESPTQDLARFISRFAPTWTALKDCLQNPAYLDNENERLAATRQCLNALLAAISGLYILQRRTLLDGVARYVSKAFTEFTFISPEESKQVDPAIHNAQGLASTAIIEGVSFAVIRRSTRQTVHYAEVRVE